MFKSNTRQLFLNANLTLIPLGTFNYEELTPKTVTEFII